ncbi:MAG TPA: PfkB family carbohydrate kinase, partial [Polyangiaceae bacterium]
SRMSAIERYGVRRVAITRGGQSILWRDGGREGEIQVPAVDVVDTLGAGDIFHGAFCRFFEASQDFVASLRRAAKVASASCAYWGTRGWIDASAPGYGDD